MAVLPRVGVEFGVVGGRHRFLADFVGCGFVIFDHQFVRLFGNFSELFFPTAFPQNSYGIFGGRSGGSGDNVGNLGVGGVGVSDSRSNPISSLSSF